jgi:maltooligosyltrehalose trehalohydrolase
MGEEYAEDSPFLYFVSHSDKDLIKAVQEGRKNEFKEFGFGDDVPDPQDENTFNECKLHWQERNNGHHKIILDWYKELIRMRKQFPSLKNFQKRDIHAQTINEKAFALFRHTGGIEEKLIGLFNLSEEEISYTISLTGSGEKILDSKESRWSTDKKHAPHPNKIENKQTILLEPLSVVVYSFK